MLKLISRYFNACSQIARQHNAARAFERRIATLRNQDEHLCQQSLEAPDDSAELIALRERVHKQFQAAVIDTAVEIAKIKTSALQAIAQRAAFTRYLANALPEQKLLVHELFNPGQPLLLQ